MSFMVQISDPEELSITFAVPGKYNPDILEDLKRRLMDAYREALAFRQKVLFETLEEAMEEVEPE